MTLTAGLFIGLVFGFVLQRVGALDYDNILKMLRLIDVKIAKFMFLSIAVGALGIFFFQKYVSISLNTLPLHMGVVVGAVIFGVGFALSGYCPGTCIGAIAEGKIDGLFTFLGALAGTLLFAVTFKWLDPLIIQKWNVGGKVLTSYMPFSSFFDSIIFAAAIIIFLVLVDKYFKGLKES